MKKIIIIVLALMALAAACYATYSLTVDKMFEVANERATNAYNYGLECGYTSGYDYAVQSARLSSESETGYTITYGNDDGNEYTK